MDIQKIAIGTIVGGIAFFLSGWAIWGTGLENFLQSHMQSYDGLLKSEPNLGLIALSCIITAFLLAVIFNRWASISTPSTGAIAGAFITAIFGLSQSISMMSGMNLIDGTHTLISFIANALWGAIGGAAIGWFLGR